MLFPPETCRHMQIQMKSTLALGWVVKHWATWVAESQIWQDIVHKIYEGMYASWLNFVKPRHFLGFTQALDFPTGFNRSCILLGRDISYTYPPVNSGHLDCTTTATDTRQREVQLEAIFPPDIIVHLMGFSWYTSCNSHCTCPLAYHMGRDSAILAYIIRSMLPRVLHSFPRIMGGRGWGICSTHSECEWVLVSTAKHAAMHYVKTKKFCSTQKNTGVVFSYIFR